MMRYNAHRATMRTIENIHNTPEHTMSINIGMSEAQRKTIAEGLAKVLADSYTLYLKTHNYHWNVEGPQFRTLHLMFEEQYTELAAAIDEFAALTSIKEGKPGTNATTMIRELVEGQETVVRTCRVLLPAVDEASDEPTNDLLTNRMQTHEKAAWMLRSLLEK